MKSRKKYFIIGGVIAVIVFTGVAFIWAHQDSFDCGRGYRHRHFGNDFQQHILDRLDQKAAELDLTKSQRQAYEKTRQKIMESLNACKQNRKQFFSKLNNEFDREAPDLNRIADLVKQHLNEMPGMVAENLDLLIGFYEQLNVEQQQRILNKIRERLNRCRV